MRDCQCTLGRALDIRGRIAHHGAGKAPDGPSEPLSGASCRVGLTRVALRCTRRHRFRVIGTQCRAGCTQCHGCSGRDSCRHSHDHFRVRGTGAGEAGPHGRPSGRHHHPLPPTPPQGGGRSVPHACGVRSGGRAGQASACLSLTTRASTTAVVVHTARVHMIEDHAPPMCSRRLHHGVA